MKSASDFAWFCRFDQTPELQLNEQQKQVK